MSILRQKTLAREATLTGIGLHTGEPVTVVFKPAPENHGLHFVRVDLPGRPRVAATVGNVTDVLRGTTIGEGERRVHTVEHLLAAVSGLGITNLEIEMGGKEPPAVDGSAKPYVECLEAAGIVEQQAPRRVLEVREPIHIIEADKQLVCLPADRFSVSFTIEYDNPVIGTQYARHEVNERTFPREIAPARTFGFYKEVEWLKEKGLARGGSLENAVVVAEDRVMNDALRFPDEFVRHKILDLVGDLALVGAAIRAHVIGVKSGHALNFALAKRLAALLDGQTSPPTKLDVNEIMKILPHRYPFLLVDRIVHLEEGRRAVGYKNVTYNEGFFQGHYPGDPVMPGVLVCEALAQVAGAFMLREEQHRGKIPYFGGIDECRFRRPVRPGDKLYLEIEVLKVRGGIGKVRGVGKVDGQVVAEATLTFSLMPPLKKAEAAS